MADEPNVYVARLAFEFLTLWLVPGDAAREEAAEHIDAAVRTRGRLDGDLAIDAELGLFSLEELLVNLLGEALGLSPIVDDRITLSSTDPLDHRLLTDPLTGEVVPLGEVDPNLYNDIMGHGLNLCARMVLMLADLQGVDIDTVLRNIAPAIHQLDE